MTDVKKAAGAVLPPGMATPPASLTPGKVRIIIESAPGENDGLFVRDETGEIILKDGQPVPAPSEHYMARCVYPDGYVKNHQAAGPDDLTPKVLGVLRNHYGVTGEIKVLSLPKKLAAGAAIEVEV